MHIDEYRSAFTPPPCRHEAVREVCVGGILVDRICLDCDADLPDTPWDGDNDPGYLPVEVPGGRWWER